MIRMSVITCSRDDLKEVVREILAGELRSVVAPQPARAYWKPREVAARYGIKDFETVRRWCKQGKVDAHKDEYSGQWLIPQSEVERLDATGGKPVSLAA
jgi:hypothetical protein